MRWSRIVALVVLLTVPAPANAAPLPAPVTGNGATPTKTVTLITGDKVSVSYQGSRPFVTVVHAPGREKITVLTRHSKDRQGEEHLMVTPVDALAPLAQGRLDRRLFDVAELIRQGRNGDELIYTRTTVLDAVSVRASRDLWETLKGSGKAWLNGRIRLSDDVSNVQIGAPQAWESGYTGKGVTVGVLDSGYDTTHPDLKEVVADAKDFTGEGITDTHGHGTHVASTIAGSGAASGGRHKGVAPDARLVVGKVCGDDTCEESAVLAGMEWAAQHAKVVSMSLGGDATDGTDPLSVAVNELTARHGALFVVAAGNNGWAGTVGTPATADAALAVGSVSKQDVLSSFSSQGPRVGDQAVKPDITAPGENIIAARAAGTSMGDPVDALHTSASGTSMATPHVSGAAAILAQRHPGWSPEQLKAGLMGTAKALDGPSVFEQGAGRLDVASAVTATIQVSPPSLSFGFVKYPYANEKPITKTLTYRNDGDAPQTLPLSRTGTAPITFSANEITVPAHGEAKVDVTFTPAALTATGGFGGRITPNVAFGGVAEVESYELTIKVIDRDGKPASGADEEDFLGISRIDDYDENDAVELVDGVAKVRLPKGVYAVDSLTTTKRGDKPVRTMASSPDFVLDRAGVVITIDARKGKKIEVLPDQKGLTRHVADVDVVHSGKTTVNTGLRARGDDELYAVPVKSDPKTFGFGVYQGLVKDGLAYYVAKPTTGAIPSSLTYRVYAKDMARDDARYRAQGIAAAGTRSAVPAYVPGQSVIFAAGIPVPLPSRRTEYYSVGEDIEYYHYLWQHKIGTPLQLEGEIRLPQGAYRKGERRATDWNSAVHGNDISGHETFNAVRRFENTIAVQSWPFAPSGQGQTAWALNAGLTVNGGTTLSTEDGKVLGAENRLITTMTMPAERARYVLDVKMSRAPEWSTLATTVSTTWRFTSERTAATEYVPLLTLRTSGKFDDYNRAPVSSSFGLDVTTGQQVGSAGKRVVTKVTVETSADDGETWTAARATGHNGDKWSFTTANPAGAKFMSVRVTATDSTGDSVEQTTIRAYGILSAGG